MWVRSVLFVRIRKRLSPKQPLIQMAKFHNKRRTTMSELLSALYWLGGGDTGLGTIWGAVGIAALVIVGILLYGDWGYHR